MPRRLLTLAVVLGAFTNDVTGLIMRSNSRILRTHSVSDFFSRNLPSLQLQSKAAETMGCVRCDGICNGQVELFAFAENRCVDISQEQEKKQKKLYLVNRNWQLNFVVPTRQTQSETSECLREQTPQVEIASNRSLAFTDSLFQHIHGFS